MLGLGGLVALGAGIADTALGIVQAQQQYGYNKDVAGLNRELLTQAYFKQIDSQSRALRAERESLSFTLEDIRNDAIAAISRVRVQAGAKMVGGRAAQLLVDTVMAERGRVQAGAEKNLQNQEQAIRDQQGAAALELQSQIFASAAGPKPNIGLIALSGFLGTAANVAGAAG